MKEEEKCCGNCAFMIGEDAYGEGQCVEVDDDGYPMMATMCNYHACEKYVSRQEMRHHMAVCLQCVRDNADHKNRLFPAGNNITKAMDFTYRYMKVFNKL